MASQHDDNGGLHIDQTLVSDRVVLKVSGRMNAENAHLFIRKSEDCVAQGHTTLVADLDGLAYVSSIGLRSFLTVAKTLQSKNGALRLCRLNGLARQVFDITGLLDAFSVYESVDSAIQGG